MMTHQASSLAARQRWIHLQPNDNVIIATEDLAAHTALDVAGITIRLSSDVQAGHKIALHTIPPGGKVIKYGFPIGHATEYIPHGTWIHSHNLATDLSTTLDYTYQPYSISRTPSNVQHQPRTFLGYKRHNGAVGTRNEIWVINTVGCVNGSAERIARMAHERWAVQERLVDGVFSFSHPFGCSQLGDDLENTRRVLAGLMRNPNAGGILVLGLGCENNQMKALLELTQNDLDPARVRSFNTQQVEDEIESGLQAIRALVDVARHDKRSECGLSELTVGVKCGGSDGFSGITANALVGTITDVITAAGGTVLQSEVPEMFGAEHILINRCKDEATFHRFVSMINSFKEYFLRHNQPVYENPSPGNKSGGLTTLEEKSLGAVQKGGTAVITQVLSYGEPVNLSVRGLALVNAPGNDGISSTAMVASGATLLLFTTGRGTPLGFPVPTLKISSNSIIAQKKPHWIDFNAGALLEGMSYEAAAEQLLDTICAVASGTQRTNNELNGYREIAIWKEGVTL
jgi:altronate hydrolase